jgi:hypothetical protein
MTAAQERIGPHPVLTTRARAVLRRRRLDGPLDWLRFRVDTFPRSRALARLTGIASQPLPWVGVDGRRARTSESRWEAIALVVQDAQVGSALDVGCNWGFFTLSMASAGVPTIGIDSDPPAVRTALYAARRSGLDHVAVCDMKVSPTTIGLLPEADGVLFLALWHHFVSDFGFEAATAMLDTIWSRTRKALFFDTGEEEMPASFGLPQMEPTPREWLSAYLEDTCAGGSVLHLGTHPAFAPDRTLCRRNLFAILR